MKVENLIDKIKEIKEIAKDAKDPYANYAYAKEAIRSIFEICNNILLDWQVEQRKAYTLADAIAELHNLGFDGIDIDDITMIITQLHNGTRKE